MLSVLERPGMISFAGGLPADETFPTLRPARLPRGYLQYGPTEGDIALRRHVAERLEHTGLKCSPEQVLILSGSQQGIDLVAKLFIDPGTRVAIESPTYLAALQVFRLFGAAFTTLQPTRPLADVVAGSEPALAYVVPTFQNPTGYCYTADQRLALASACDESAVPLYEDDPYRDLAYERCERTPVCAHIRRAAWIYQGSFSKSLAPGLRLGFLAASSELVPHLTRLKQAADLHSSRVCQWLVLEQLRHPARSRRLDQTVAFYRRKRDRFAKLLQKHFKDLARWDIPAGGLFFWLRLRDTIDTRELLSRALEQGVAFAPGEFFYADRPSACGTLRLNFSHASTSDAERGLAVLVRLLGRS